MKKYVISIVLILFACSINAQSGAENIAKINEIETQVKAIQQSVKDLNKEAFNKKVELNKEIDLAKKDQLLIENNNIKQRIKEKNDAIAQLKKQLRDLKKQQVNTTVIEPKIAKIVTTKTTFLNDSSYYIEIFEHPNYQGSSYKVTKYTNVSGLNIGNNGNKISFKKGPGLFKAFVQIKYISDFILEKNEPNISLNLSELIAVKFQELPSIQIFEQPNYRGNSIKILDIKQVKNINFPFQSNNISIKFSNEDKTIVYLAEKNSLDYKVFVKNEPNLSISTQNIKSVYIGNKVLIEVRFNGILTSAIHNNDCKKMYGQISFQIYENPLAISNGVALDRMNIVQTKNIGERIGDNNIYKVFNKEKDNNYLCPFLYNICNYCSTTNGGYPLVNIVDRRRGRHNLAGQLYLQNAAITDNAVQLFYIDSGSLFSAKGIASLIMKVKIKLGSAHKSNDLANDFTWDAVMNEEIEDLKNTNEYVLIDNKAVNIFQFGPYRKHSLGYPRVNQNNTKEIALNNFSGPEHETYVQFSIKIK